MKQKNSLVPSNARRITGMVIRYPLAVLVTVIMVFPLFWMLSTALKGIGNGGGHMSMAGGIVYPEQRAALGDPYFMEAVIRDRILNAYHDLSEESKNV